MALPTQQEIHVPLLKEIDARGGDARPGTELYRAVASHFPRITESDLKEAITSGANRWERYVNYARLKLVHRGEIDKSVYGVWRITDKGRLRLREEGPSKKGPEPLPERTFKIIREESQKPQPFKRHDELKQKMIDIGKKLGYYVSAEEGPEYRHDVLWKITQYKTPSHVIEVCEGGVLAKDFDALNWARENWDARGILIVTDDKDFTKASRRLAGQPRIIAVKAETIDLLYELINADLELLKSIFGEHSKW